MRNLAALSGCVPILWISALGPTGLTGPAAAASPVQEPAGESFPYAEERPPHFEALPPELPWDGRSLELAVPEDHPWVTPFEESGLVDSPPYDETVAWLRRLVEEAPELEMVSLGETAEGRDLWMVIASAEGADTPEALHAAGKPVLFAHAGIHSGEIDGKDAGMMLLWDLTVRGTRAELLERASFLFVPVLSADAHERRSPYGRINQRGPLHTGWRTNSRNLNLNRDFAKLETREVRHLAAALDRWRPDLYLDLHVTDGADYQYDITFGWTHPDTAWSPAAARWLDEVYRPEVSEGLREMGHVPGPLVFTVDRYDWRRGIFRFAGGVRFSNGYGDARHLPTVLVENHSLKPYGQRVLGTYVLLAESLRLLGERGGELRDAVVEDRARRPGTLTLDWSVDRDAEPPTVEFLGVEQRLERSDVSGDLRVIWTGEPVTAEVPVLAATEPAATAERPAAYWIPPAWRDVIGRLEAHGVELEKKNEPTELEVEMYRLTEPELEEMPFEGHVRASATPVAERRREVFPPGSVRVPTDQPLGTLAMLLLEPASPDSFFQWGFFHEVLSRTEYAEGYVLEPLAERMLAEDPELREAFEEKLATDEELRTDPRARLQWFYEKTPYWDDRWRLYPVAREVEAAP
ncbi:MAG: M14 family metallopeptidase [Acidobacteriota bacterium]